MTLRLPTFRGIRTQLTAAVSLPFALIAVFIFFFGPNRLRHGMLLSAADKVESLRDLTAYSVSAGLLFADTSAVRDALRGTQQSHDVAFIEVQDNNGEMFAVVEPERAARETCKDDRELTCETTDGLYFVTSGPILHNGRTIGYLRLGLSLENVHHDVSTARRVAMVVCLLILVGGVAIAAGITTLVTRPLSHVATTAERIAAGDLHLRAEVTTNDEVATLVRAFNRMVESVEAAQEQLAESNRHLEARVEQRTAALLLVQEDLRQAKEAAEGASRAKSEFLARMSHELRTPLNSVIGFANVLLKNRQQNLASTEVEYASRIASNGRHLLSLINDILDLSKIEAGKMMLDVSPVDVSLLVRDVVNGMEGRAEPGVAVLVEAPAGLAPLETDALKLKQVLINLVGNALKFTQQGVVAVTVVGDPKSQHVARIEVADTGIGIPHDRLASIFEAFEQAEGTTSRRFGGTGLGLTVSRALCELLGFSLEVESKEGKGTTFVLSLASVHTGRERLIAVA